MIEPPPSTRKGFDYIWSKWLYNLWAYVMENAVSNYDLDVSRGLISGVTWVNKFGRNPTVDDGVLEEIWTGSAAYVYPDTALMTSISQTTDQAALRGGTIEIQGLDANWEEVIQTATLDASDTTTVVTLTTALIRCYRMKVLEDVITTSQVRVHNAAETQDYAIIGTGLNQTEMAIYTVPANKTAFMTNYYAHHNPKTGNNFTKCPIKIWAKDNANVYERQQKHVTGLAEDGWFQHNFKPYPKFTEKTDIYITAQPTGADADISAGFDLYIVDN